MGRETREVSQPDTEETGKQDGLYVNEVSDPQGRPMNNRNELI